MTSLREGIAEYLELRRSLGFRLKKDELYLGDFADFMERRHATNITAKLAVQWARLPASTDANYLAGRLRAVRMPVSTVIDGVPVTMATPSVGRISRPAF